jgi:transcriptional regulator with XRE-family HTH domain
MPRGGKGKGPGAWQTSASYERFRAKLVAARDAAGLTQRTLAQRLGKPHSWVSKIESKERRMDVIEFIAVARALGLKEADLMRAIGAELRKLEF